MTEQPGIRAHTIGPSENDGCAVYLQPVSLGGSPSSADEELHESNDHIGQDKKSHQSPCRIGAIGTGVLPEGLARRTCGSEGVPEVTAGPAAPVQAGCTTVA